VILENSDGNMTYYSNVIFPFFYGNTNKGMKGK